MSINESQQTLPLSNSINLNLEQITMNKLQQNPFSEPSEYLERRMSQQQISSLNNNQNYLDEYDKSTSQQEISSLHCSQNQQQQEQTIIEDPLNNSLMNKQEQFSPTIINPQENQYQHLVQEERVNQFSNILTFEPHTSNCFIIQRQSNSPNQQINNEERFMSSTPVKQIQSFYLNNDNINQNQFQNPDSEFNIQSDNGIHLEQQNQMQYKQQQQQEESLVQKLYELNNSSRSEQKSQENNNIILQSNIQTKEETIQNYPIMNQSDIQNSLLNTLEDNGNSILQGLQREEQFQNEIQYLKLNQSQQQIQLDDQSQNQAAQDSEKGDKQFNEVEMFAQRENLQNQLFELNGESESLYNEALQFINITKQKYQGMDTELQRQKQQLDDFCSKINEMKSIELTSGLQNGDENIFLKKMDLQKLLFKIEDLKLQAQVKSRNQSPTKKGQIESSRSYFQNSEEKLKKKIQINASSSQILQQSMIGKNYLSPKKYLEATERILKNPNESIKYTLTPPKNKLNTIKIGNDSYPKQQPNLKDSLQQQNFSSEDRTANASIVAQNLNQQLKLTYKLNSQGDLRNSDYFNTLYTQSTPKKNSSQIASELKFQSDFKQNINEIQPDQQKSFSSNKKSASTSLFQYSPQKNKQGNNLQNYTQSPGCIQSNNYHKFVNLENHIFLVQSKTVNSPIISLLGKDRLVVARPFKGTLQKNGSNRVITDGDTYQFEHINMLVNQITKTIRQEILIKNSLDNLYKNIFIIGTKSSQKKTIQLDILQLLKETFRTKVLTMISNNYSCRIKLRYHENIFENPTTISKLPSSPSKLQSQSQSQDKSYPICDEISIDFNPLDPNIEDKILIFDEAISRIAKLIIDAKKAKIPLSKSTQYSQINSSFLRSKIRTLKLSLVIISNATIVCKQSYRISTSNHIIDPERRTPTQIFRETFHFGSTLQQQNQSTFRSLGYTQIQNQQYQSQHSPSIGFKDETVFGDDNMVIFSCAPIMKYFEQVRALFKSAHIFEKYFRKLNKQV